MANSTRPQILGREASLQWLALANQLLSKDSKSILFKGQLN
jgi:hypothetical protein